MKRLVDGIGLNRGDPRGALAPDPLAVVTACRYARSGDSLLLIAQRSTRTALEPVRAAVNSAYTSRESADQSVCAGTTAPQRLDILWLADVTGEVTEVWIPRAECPEILRIYPEVSRGGARIPAALATTLDGWLR